MNNKKEYIAPQMETITVADETMLSASENIQSAGASEVRNIYDFVDIFNR